MKTSFPVPAALASVRVLFFPLAVACSLFEASLHGAEAYSLQVVAFSNDFPPSPDNPNAIIERGFAAPPNSARLADSGVLTFPVQWRDSRLPGNSLQLTGGTPGALAPIVETQKPVPGLSQYVFGLSGFSAATAQFPSWAVNNAGELLLVGGANGATDPAAGAGGIWKGHAGGMTLLAARMIFTRNGVQPAGAPPVNVSGLPATGTSTTLVWRTLDAALELCENGSAFFSGNIDGWSPDPNSSGNFVGASVVQDGLFEITGGGMRLVARRSGAAPDTGGIRVYSAPLAPLISQRSGDFITLAVTSPSGAEADPALARTEIHDYRNGVLRAVHRNGDALPDLSPSPASTDLVLANSIDATSSGLFSATAGGSRLGWWKLSTAGKQTVVIFGRDVTLGSAGSGRFAPTSAAVQGSATIGAGRAVFIAAFTPAGTTQPQEGIFRETPGGLDRVIVANGAAVPGTDFVLGGPFRQVVTNERGDILFSVPSRRTTESTFVESLWLADRNGAFHRLVAAGQNLQVGVLLRTVGAFWLDGGSSRPRQVINDSGVVAFFVTFTGGTSAGTSAILRAVPSGYSDPPKPAPPGKVYRFSEKFGSNWHGRNGNVANWEDENSITHPQAPGDADANTATVIIPGGRSATLSDRAASVGAVTATGNLTISQRLTVNSPSVVRDIRLSGPNAVFTGNVTTVEFFKARLENRGRIEAAGATIKNMGDIDVIDGTITATGVGAAFENRGKLNKDGPGEVTITAAPKSIGPAGTAPARDAIEVKQGKLSLIGGGASEGNVRKRLAKDAGLKLTGDFEIKDQLEIVGPADRDGATKVELGDDSRSLQIQSSPGSTIILDVSGAGVEFNSGLLAGRGAVLENRRLLAWSGGRIAFEPVPEGRFGNFYNRGTIRIQGNGAHVRGGSLGNEPASGIALAGQIEQASPLAIEGVVQNGSRWTVTRPTTISGEGRVWNSGDFAVTLDTPGVVEVTAGFDCTNDVDNIEGGSVTVGRLGPFTGSAPATTLRFRSRLGNVKNGALDVGRWRIGRAATLEVAEDVFSIRAFTTVEIDARAFPALKLGQLFGALSLRETSYIAPGSVMIGTEQNHFYSALRLEAASMTVPGRLDNFGRIVCDRNSSLTIGGDFNHDPAARLTLNGRLVVRGTFFAFGAITGDGGTIEAQEVIGLGPIEPGESPGTLNLNARLSLGAAAELSMEMAGREAARFDVINVNGAAALGGTLLVPLLNGFTPGPTDTFAIVQATAITGRFSNVASGQRLFTTDGRGSLEVHYGAGSAFGANRVVLANWQPAPTGGIAIGRAPAAETVKAGAPLVLSVNASGAVPLTYQWRFRGAPIAGATQATFTVPGAQAYDQGSYSVVVTNATGSVVSAANVTVDDTTSPSARLLNLSTRALGPAGSEAFISGFVLQGAGSARMLLRTIGPGLGAFGVPNTLPNPQMVLQRLAGANYVPQATNTDWGVNANASAIVTTTQSVGGFPLATGSLDSALLVDLVPGQYSVVASDSANRTGTAIIELYDTTAAGADVPRLVNISTRGFVGAGGDVMIPGFVISPEGARTLLVRAVGPTLSTFGVTGALSDPQITLYRRESGGTDTPVFTNNDWGTSPTAATLPAVAASVGAFALPTGSKDAALLVTLQPGAYTVHVSGGGGATGTALVEIYLVP